MQKYDSIDVVYALIIAIADQLRKKVRAYDVIDALIYQLSEHFRASWRAVEADAQKQRDFAHKREIEIYQVQVGDLQERIRRIEPDICQSGRGDFQTRRLLWIKWHRHGNGMCLRDSANAFDVKYQESFGKDWRTEVA